MLSFSNIFLEKDARVLFLWRMGKCARMPERQTFGHATFPPMLISTRTSQKKKKHLCLNTNGVRWQWQYEQTLKINFRKHTSLTTSLSCNRNDLKQRTGRKQSTGKWLKKDNFTSYKLVSADYHPKHSEVGALNISSAAMHHWANVFAHQYVNKILSFLKVDPQTLEETETVFEYAANIRWTNDGRDRMQISALCISRVRSLPRNIHFIQK